MSLYRLSIVACWSVLLLFANGCALLPNKKPIVKMSTTLAVLDIESSLAFVRVFSGLSVEDQRRDLGYLAMQWKKDRTTESRIKYILALTHSYPALNDDVLVLSLLEEIPRPEPIDAELSSYLKSLYVLVQERVRQQKEAERKLQILQQKNEGLLQKHETLQQRYDNLNQKYENLQQKHDGLQQKLDTSNQKLQALQKKLDELRDIERVNLNASSRRSK